MPLNSLKLDDNNTEFLPIHSKFVKSTYDPPNQIGDATANSTQSARNLGVVFDNALTLKPRINSVCKSAYFHIQCISQIRKHLTLQATKTIFHSLISSRLDYCNSIKCNLSRMLLLNSSPSPANMTMSPPSPESSTGSWFISISFSKSLSSSTKPYMAFLWTTYHPY